MIEERIIDLEREVRETKEELTEILIDIRAFIMEAQNPLKRFELQKADNKTQEGGEGKW